MTTAPVVVGVDGSAAGLRAVDLAVREAEARDRPLRMVYADTGRRTAVAPERVVGDAAELVRARSWVPVTGRIVAGDPATVLIAESRRAALLVLGHRGHDRRFPVALGSVARTVIFGVACPVIVVRGPIPIRAARGLRHRRSPPSAAGDSGPGS